MITENLSTLKIHKLTQEQYEREIANGNIDGSALYLTPDEEKTLTEYFAEESMVLSNLQYGDSLPTAGKVGRVFFKKVNS